MLFLSNVIKILIDFEFYFFSTLKNHHPALLTKMTKGLSISYQDLKKNHTFIYFLILCTI